MIRGSLAVSIFLGLSLYLRVPDCKRCANGTVVQNFGQFMGVGVLAMIIPLSARAEKIPVGHWSKYRFQP